MTGTSLFSSTPPDARMQESSETHRQGRVPCLDQVLPGTAMASSEFTRCAAHLRPTVALPASWQS